MMERERKLVYILENLVAEEFSQDDFLEFLAKEKGKSQILISLKFENNIQFYLSVYGSFPSFI